MSIITISRGTYSGGRKLAETLAADLGYRLMSWELLYEAARQYGVKLENLKRGLERAPRFWDRFRIDRRIYTEVVRAALCKVAREDNLVFHGHAGHLLLSGFEQVLRVRVISSIENRARAAMEEERIDEKTAFERIAARDAERKSWTRFIYGVEWSDPSLYDLVINLEKLSLERVAAMVADISRQPEYRITSEGLTRLDNIFLESHVHAKLFLRPSIAAAAAKIVVKADDGVVYLSGVLPGDSFLEQVLETASSLPEVREVKADWLASFTPPA